MKTNWSTFGSKDRFAFEYRFLNDPDNGQAATPLESASWGEFRFWVRGRNLCQCHHHGKFHQEAAWYLSPILFWLAENWDPLFHEERFPTECNVPNARAGYLDSLKRFLGDTDPVMEAKGEAWFGWWQRHALRSCRQGGLFPDLFLRRMVDFAEISWGNSHMEGVGEDFYFTVPQGTVCLPVKQVAEPLLKGLQTAIADLRGRIASDKEFNTLAEKADRITAPGRLNDRLSWYAARLSHIATSVQSLVQNMITPEEGMGFIQRLSPGVAMFGSLAPKISDADLENLIGFYIAAHKNGKESSQLLPLLTQNPELPENDPFDAGYEAALDFLEAQNQNNSLSEWVDVHSICQRLGIQIYSGALGDSNIRGAAFAGSHVTPTIFINTAHPNNQQEEGQRFSIGHELCHILHDRFFGGEISIASGPWAPASIEKRANAFSAMLLMPVELINEKIRISPSPPDTPEGITYLSNALKVSKKSLVWHLYNLNKLDDTQLANLAGYEF